jgi:hypothetical protein
MQRIASPRTLVLYEPPWPRALGQEAPVRLEALARAGDWDGFAVTFFRDRLSVPGPEMYAAPGLEGVREATRW